MQREPRNLRLLAAMKHEAHLELLAAGQACFARLRPGCQLASRSSNAAMLRFPSAEGLTFDVRGGPLAGRPLDGGVRHHWGLLMSLLLEDNWEIDFGNANEVEGSGERRIANFTGCVLEQPVLHYKLSFNDLCSRKCDGRAAVWRGGQNQADDGIGIEVDGRPLGNGLWVEGYCPKCGVLGSICGDSECLLDAHLSGLPVPQRRCFKLSRLSMGPAREQQYEDECRALHDA